jgi:hypothetical protein
VDTEVTDHFDGIIELARQAFRQVKYTIDTSPQRAILKLNARYDDLRLIVVELFSDSQRKYRYYALREEWVTVGFDNSPDPRAIRLKYGRIGKEHVGELVPHLHLHNKTELYLTDDIMFADFVAWLQENHL